VFAAVRFCSLMWRFPLVWCSLVFAGVRL